jgi:hypothetical protein
MEGTQGIRWELEVRNVSKLALAPLLILLYFSTVGTFYLNTLDLKNYKRFRINGNIIYVTIGSFFGFYVDFFVTINGQ